MEQSGLTNSTEKDNSGELAKFVPKLLLLFCARCAFVLTIKNEAMQSNFAAGFNKAPKPSDILATIRLNLVWIGNTCTDKPTINIYIVHSFIPPKSYRHRVIQKCLQQTLSSWHNTFSKEAAEDRTFRRHFG
jgi:hypothetical protein